MNTVIFACVHNAGRSQMAAAFFNRFADPERAHAVSAGTQPGERVHPVVVDAMKEVGFDLSTNVPTLLTSGLLEAASHLITMGCGEACPVAPARVVKDDWPLADPKHQPLERVRAIRDEIGARVAAFVREHGWAKS